MENNVENQPFGYTNLIKPNIDLEVTLLKEYFGGKLTLNSSDVKLYRGTGYGCYIQMKDGSDYYVQEPWETVDGAWSI